jgi:glycosyltransferase involved in cell wall biosynthesis
MKNIVFLCTSDSRGGLEFNVVKLAESLLKKKHNLKIYTITGSLVLELALEKKIPVVVIKKHSKYFDLPNAFSLVRNLKNDNIDFLFVFHNRDQSIAAIAKSIYPKIKLIYQQQMQLGISKKDFFHSQRYSKFDAWITPLKILSDEVIRMTNFNKKKIHVIPLGVDCSKYSENSLSKSESRKILGLPPEIKLVGIIGRIDKQKGQLTLIKSLALINDDNIKLVIAGEPTKGEGQIYFNEIKKYIDIHNLNSRVFIIPFVKEPEIFYRAIDIFGLGSLSETYGMVTIEAMVCGLPVIATNTGGTPEILNFGEFGYLYNPGNETEFAEKVNFILSNPEDVIKKTSMAKIWAINNYSLEKECNMFESLINSF